VARPVAVGLTRVGKGLAISRVATPREFPLGVRTGGLMRISALLPLALASFVSTACVDGDGDAPDVASTQSEINVSIGDLNGDGLVNWPSDFVMVHYRIGQAMNGALPYQNALDLYRGTTSLSVLNVQDQKMNVLIMKDLAWDMSNYYYFDQLYNATINCLSSTTAACRRYDHNQDGGISPLDVLLVINFRNFAATVSL
jgi:hypothetical protein